MNDQHAEKHEKITLSLEKLTATLNVLLQRLQEDQTTHRETRSLLEAAMRTLGYEYSQDAKRWVKAEKLAALIND